MTDQRRKILKAVFLCLSQFQWLVGMVVGLVGLHLWVNYRQWSVFFSPSPYAMLPFIFIWVTAALLMLSGFLGSCMDSKDSTCLKGVFVYLLVVIFCMGSTASALVFQRSINLDSEVQPLSGVFQNYTGSSQDQYSRAVDDLQESIQCCGVHNYTDWWDTSWFHETGGHKFPLSCCNTTFTSCNATVLLPLQFYQMGCHEKLQTAFHVLLNIIILTFALVFLEQVIVLVIVVQLKRDPLFQRYQALVD